MKSYFANSFRVAMEQARKEMGPEAMLVTTRPAAAESRHLGHYEIVFAAGLPPATDVAAPIAQTSDNPAGAQLSSMLAEMRRQLHSGRGSAAPQSATGIPAGRGPLDDLVKCDVSPEIARQLLSAAEKRKTSGGLRAALAEEIRSAVRVDSRMSPSADGKPAVIALVGPPGAGKTATIAKLAVRNGLKSRRPAVLISAEMLRVGASEQLRCYASLLGLGFEVVETNRALEQSLEEHRNKELILIDTPGFTFSDLESAGDLAGMLARRDDIRKHLVLPASMRYSDIARVSAAYKIFRPSHLIFTRMDETCSYGAVVSEAIASRRPVSFLAAGQKVPEDLSEANSRDLAELILPSPDSGAGPVEMSRLLDTLQTAA